MHQIYVLLTGFNCSLSTSVCEENFPNITQPAYEWLDIQSRLTKETDVTASVKSSQANLVNRILSNSNYAVERLV